MQRLGDRTCVASLAGSGTKNAQLLARVFQDKCHPSDCAEKLCAQDLSKFPNQGTCMVDGGETVGNSLHGESCVWRERDGSDDRVDGGETVGNSFGRAPRERFSETFAKLSSNFRMTLFSMHFLGKKSCFSAGFSQKNEKFHLGFYQKKGFRLNFLQKMIFSLICPNDVFFFTETFFSQKLTNLSEISHVIPCYSLLCFFVCFQRIAFPPVRFK